jgi:arylsulfatase A-like enzyme
VGRRVLAVALVLGVVAAGLVVVLLNRDEGSTAEPERPNIVVFMTDDQTAESLRVMANVDELITDRGVSFENAFASFPLCCPSRATYLTGQYGHNHGVMGNTPPNGGVEALRDPGTTFPVALERAGYRTVHIGKYLNGYGARQRPAVPPGWSEWWGAVDPSTYRYFGYQLLTPSGVERYGDAAEDYQSDVYADLAVDAVSEGRRDDRPFFVEVAFLAPHNALRLDALEDASGEPLPAPRHAGRLSEEPLPVSEAFDEEDVGDKPAVVRALPRITDEERRSIVSGYRARLESLLAVDEAIERVVEELRSRGELERTVLVFTSDNGFMHGEHRIPDGKGQVYDPATRIPLVISGPGLAQGATERSVVGNVDLAPTILDLAGVDALREMDGRSLVPQAREPGAPGGAGVLLEMGGPYRRTTGVRDSRYLYVERPTGERELYDVASDPEQLENRAGDPALAPVVASMAAQLDRLRTCAGRACRA